MYSHLELRTPINVKPHLECVGKGGDYVGTCIIVHVPRNAANPGDLSTMQMKIYGLSRGFACLDGTLTNIQVPL